MKISPSTTSMIHCTPALTDRRLRHPWKRLVASPLRSMNSPISTSPYTDTLWHGASWYPELWLDKIDEELTMREATTSP